MSKGSQTKTIKKPPVRMPLVFAVAWFILMVYVYVLGIVVNEFQIRAISDFIIVSIIRVVIFGIIAFLLRKKIDSFLRPAPDNFAKAEAKIGWFVVALAFGIFVIFFCVGLLWLYHDYRISLIASTQLQDLEWNREYATSICVGAFAFWGFVVVVWRGLLHHEQVTNQIKQLDLGNKQQRETENNNLAKLMISGAEKLNPDMPEEQQVTGMACLSYIVKNNGSFTSEAVGIIKALVERTGKQNPKGVYIETNQLF